MKDNENKNNKVPKLSLIFKTINSEEKIFDFRKNVVLTTTDEIKDESYFGKKIVIGGSYEFVQHFADSSTHEAHHLIPQKLLIITGILKVSEGPSIRMEKKDHQLTRSYKRRDMLKNDFFRKQQEYLEALNIREAVEMEIADIQAKFGSKYDDAIREVRKYVAKLEKQLKNHNGGINEKANS